MAETLDELFAGLEAAAPSPAGGTAAAVVAAMAASLVGMVGRESPAWPAGAETAARAVRLREQLVALGIEDVQAFAAVIAASRAGDSDALTAALVHASEVPLQIAEHAADVAEIATRAATDGKRPLQPDADAAAILAEAATRAAALLVRVNVAALPASSGNETAARLLGAAQTAEDRAAG